MIISFQSWKEAALVNNIFHFTFEVENKTLRVENKIQKVENKSLKVENKSLKVENIFVESIKIPHKSSSTVIFWPLKNHNSWLFI